MGIIRRIRKMFRYLLNPRRFYLRFRRWRMSQNCRVVYDYYYRGLSEAQQQMLVRTGARVKSHAETCPDCRAVKADINTEDWQMPLQRIFNRGFRLFE